MSYPDDIWFKTRLDVFLTKWDKDYMLADFEDYLYWKKFSYLKRFEYVCIVRMYLSYIDWSIKNMDGESYVEIIQSLLPEIQKGNRNIIRALKKYSFYMRHYNKCSRDYIRIAKKEIPHAFDHRRVFPVYPGLTNASAIEFHYYNIEEILIYENEKGCSIDLFKRFDPCYMFDEGER